MIMFIFAVLFAAGAYWYHKRNQTKKETVNKLGMIALSVLAIIFLLVGISNWGNGSTASDNKPKTQKATKPKHYDKNTAAGLKGYLNQKTNNSLDIKSVKTIDNVITIKTSGVTFNGKVAGAGACSDIVDAMKYAKSSKLSANGIAFVQTDTYTDSKGNDSKDTDYVIYYSKSALDSLNFKNYSNVVANNKETLLDNSTGYYFNPSFKDSGDDWIFGNMTLAKGNDTVTDITADVLN